MKKNIYQKIKDFKFRGIDYYAIRGISSKIMRDKIIEIIISKREKSYKVNSTSLLVEHDSINRHIENMNGDGFTIFDYKLSPEKLENIISFIMTLSCNDPYRKNLGSIDPANPPQETHIANYERADLVRNKDILDIANDSGVISIAQDFLGATPTISNINVWWSFGGRVQAEEAQLYHRDVDDWKFCKFFVYLTDVESENGPHIYVKGTSVSDKLRKIRRYEDKEVEDTFGKENVTTFIKPKGSAFMVDTYGFHKGLIPKSGRRLLLQIQYSLNPLKVETYNPVLIHNDDVINFDKYINRLIFKQ